MFFWSDGGGRLVPGLCLRLPPAVSASGQTPGWLRRARYDVLVTTRGVILSVTLQLLARVVAEGRSWDWVLPAAIAHGATELSTAVDRNTPAVSRMTGRFP